MLSAKQDPGIGDVSSFLQAGNNVKANTLYRKNLDGISNFIFGNQQVAFINYLILKIMPIIARTV
jgi:hypothetical protein